MPDLLVTAVKTHAHCFLGITMAYYLKLSPLHFAHRRLTF